MGKLILVLVGATAGVALAVFIAARRESRGPETVQPLASTAPPATPTTEAASAAAATSAAPNVAGAASREASAGE